MKQINTTNWEAEFEKQFGAFAILGSAGRFYNGAFANEARISEAKQFIKDLLASSQKDKEIAVEEERERIINELPKLADEFEKEMWMSMGGMGLVHLFVQKAKESLTTKERNK